MKRRRADPQPRPRLQSNPRSCPFPTASPTTSALERDPGLDAAHRESQQRRADCSHPCQASCDVAAGRTRRAATASPAPASVSVTTCETLEMDDQQPHRAAGRSLLLRLRLRACRRRRPGQDGRVLIPDRPALALPGVFTQIDLATSKARHAGRHAAALGVCERPSPGPRRSCCRRDAGVFVTPGGAGATACHTSMRPLGLSRGRRELGTCIITRAVSFGGSSFGHSSSNRPPPTTFSPASP